MGRRRVSSRDGLRWCPGCQTWQDPGQFCRDAEKADGLASHCRACRREEFARWFRANAGSKRAYQRAYKRTHRTCEKPPEAILRGRLSHVG